jgi:hypothetical protein
MAFKKIPSSKEKKKKALNLLNPIFMILVDGYTENKIIRIINTNNNNNNTNIVETAEKRSLSNLFDMPSKLDFSTLQSIAHQTGLFSFLLFEFF